MKNNQKGFTLVELLIVIALLGALAVGLLASLDPFEQFKKGDDTGVRNTVSEIQGAIIRYYSIKNSMPWSDVGFTGTANEAVFTNTYIQAIIETGELKRDFLTLAKGQLAKIFITADDQNVGVCFRPDSKAFRADPNTKFFSNGTEQTGCPTTSLTCYWCVK